MLKMALTNIGFPAEDLAGYVEGSPLAAGGAGDDRGGEVPQAAGLPEGRLPGVPCGGQREGRIGRDRAALRGGEDPGGPRHHGPLQVQHPGAHHQRDRGAPMDPRDPRQDHPDRGSGGRVYRRFQDPRARDRGHLPDHHLPQAAERGLPPFRHLLEGQLGPHHLRRGASPAGPGVPHLRGHAGHAPPRSHGHPHPRGRPPEGRVLADRPQEVRSAVEGPGSPGVDSHRHLHGNPRAPEARGQDGLCHGRPAQENHPGLLQPGEVQGGQGAGGEAQDQTGCSSSGNTWSSSKPWPRP